MWRLINRSMDTLSLFNFFFLYICYVLGHMSIDMMIILYICCICVDPAFRLMRFPFDGELDFNLKNDFYWLRKWLGVATYFCFIFKRVNKIRKKTLSTTLYFGKGDLRKTGSGSGVRLLVGKVRKDCSTPLSP